MRVGNERFQRTPVVSPVSAATCAIWPAGCWLPARDSQPFFLRFTRRARCRERKITMQDKFLAALTVERWRQVQRWVAYLRPEGA